MFLWYQVEIELPIGDVKFHGWHCLLAGADQASDNPLACRRPTIVILEIKNLKKEAVVSFVWNLGTYIWLYIHIVNLFMDIPQIIFA